MLRAHNFRGKEVALEKALKSQQILIYNKPADKKKSHKKGIFLPFNGYKLILQQ